MQPIVILGDLPAKPEIPAESQIAVLAEPAILTIGSLCFGFLFSYPLLSHLGEKTQVLDWTRGLEWAWADWITIVKFHQFPLWNPYKCGGLESLGNPQSHLLTPFFLLHWIFGPVAGLQLEIPLHLAVAFAGAYVLARMVGCSAAASVASGLTFAGSSWLPLHAAAGHDVFYSGAYIPWACAMTWASVQQRRITYAGLAGFFLALTFFEGGAYCVIQSVILIGLICTLGVLTRRSAWPIASLVLTGLFGLGFVAIKLFPAIHEMGLHPRGGYVDWIGPYNTLLSIFSRKQNFEGAFGGGGFWEHGAYISPALAVFALIGALVRWREAWIWSVGAATFYILAMGSTSEYSPYVLLHNVPFIASTYAPSRNLLSFVLCVAVLAGLGADLLLYGLRYGLPGKIRTKVRWATIAFIAVGFADLLMVSPRSLNQAFDGNVAVPTMPYSPQFRQYRDPNSSTDMLQLNLSNIGAVNCWETNFIDYSKNNVFGFNQPGYRGEQYILGSGAVELSKWTPNALSYDIDSGGPSTLVINQVYDDGWKLTEGTGTLVDHDGLLGILIASGHQQIRVAYRGVNFRLGMAISILTTIVLFLIWWWERKAVLVT